jgi:hypothetical protein
MQMGINPDQILVKPISVGCNLLSKFPLSVLVIGDERYDPSEHMRTHVEVGHKNFV